jgi:type IV secretion system protein VirB9
MSRVGFAVALAAVFLLASAADAAVIPAPSAADPRVRIVRYAPDEVVELAGTLGYAVTVEFGAGERIENVSIGDSLAWQVTPNRRANLLFLKPIDHAAPTNMTVVTNLRAYTFNLRIRGKGRGGGPLIFALKFDYPEPAMVAADAPVPPPPPEPPKDINHAYSYQGSAKGLPVRVFDDGRSTYFSFAESVDYPAIFAVDPDNKEAAVNVAQRDGYVVVDRLACAFVLRRGAEVTRIVNDGYRPDGPQTSTLSPHRNR